MTAIQGVVSIRLQVISNVGVWVRNSYNNNIFKSRNFSGNIPSCNLRTGWITVPSGMENLIVNHFNGAQSLTATFTGRQGAPGHNFALNVELVAQFTLYATQDRVVFPGRSVMCEGNFSGRVHFVARGFTRSVGQSW
jgi:hypothetical protein